MKYFITGGFGFFGTNLSFEVIRRNEELFIMDNFYRNGSRENQKWLQNQGALKFIPGDISNENDVETAIKQIKPDIIFHIAGQVAMTTSLENPRRDFEINALGTFNILESVRKYSPNSIVMFSSTNKVYGDLEYLDYIETETRYIPKNYPNGFDENLLLNFQSPYGCSKGAADQYVLDYAKMFNVKSIVFRHSTIYGSRQFATNDQGWIGWFCQKALEVKKGISQEKFTISGSGKQVRDILYIDDAVDLYFKAIEKIDKIKGQAFNIGGGINNSFSLLELFSYLEENFKITLNYKQIQPRKSDQKFFVADLAKVISLVDWKPQISKENGIEKIIEWLK